MIKDTGDDTIIMLCVIIQKFSLQLVFALRCCTGLHLGEAGGPKTGTNIWDLKENFTFTIVTNILVTDQVYKHYSLFY